MMSILKVFKKITFLLFTIAFVNCGARKNKNDKDRYDQDEIKNMAEWKFGYDLMEIDFCELYIIDGIIYDRNTVNQELTNYNKTDFSSINFVKQTQKKTYFDKPCELFVLLSTRKQTDKEKELILKKVTTFYNETVPKVLIRDWQCKECKALSVNGKIPMLPYEAKEFLNSLKVDDIRHITIYDEPVNVGFFGSNHKNGLIEIMLK